MVKDEMTMQWTEITDENIHHVYNLDPDRLVIAHECFGMKMYRMNRDYSPTISTMAKNGRYYYMELPELKINEQNK